MTGECFVVNVAALQRADHARMRNLNLAEMRHVRASTCMSE